MHIVTSTDILLPRAEDMGAWSVIACDQFTSEPEYWAAAEARAAEKAEHAFSHAAGGVAAHRARRRRGRTHCRYDAPLSRGGCFSDGPGQLYLCRAHAVGRTRPPRPPLRRLILSSTIYRNAAYERPLHGGYRGGASAAAREHPPRRAARNAAYAPSDGRPDGQCALSRKRRRTHWKRSTILTLCSAAATSPAGA